jgi:hypothetical protein
MLKKLLLIFLFISVSTLSFSQITLSSPVLRQVFQRDLNNQAIVTITGSYSQPIDTLQARFIPVKSTQGVAVDWTVIKANPLGGLFKGSVTVKGGWYTMEVRGLLNGKVVGNISTLERVGVGEVFVIAGQSNAGGSGLLEANETAATDDRVNCANFISPRTYNPRGWDTLNVSASNRFPYFRADLSQFSIVEFSQLKKTSAIGPMGLGPYYWGKVGDALSAKLNVPIMFFNTGWAGASARVWRESAENPDKRVPSDFFPNEPNFAYPLGYPYANLNAVLRYYGINMGVRAVLWMEGETHNLLNLEAIAKGEKPPTTVETYLDDLRRLVKRTRQDLGTTKLAWVVARTSYSSQLNCGNALLPPAPSPIIVNAQNQVITDPTLAPMYPGPFTDNIQIAKIGEREQCVHFTGKGLDEVANSWIKALTEDNKNFFETVEPILADTIPSITLDCISSQTLRLSLPAGYVENAYIWVNTANNQTVGTTRSINVGSGTYIARVTRSNGNIIQIPRFTVKANTPPLAPTITASSDVNFCLGTSVTLSSNTTVDSPIFQWIDPTNTILGTKNISATREGAYKLKVVDKNACQSTFSNEIKLTAKPRPEAPVIATSGNTEFCDGQNVKLTSSSVGASGYLWSNGETNQVITVGKTGTFFVQTRGSNGCLSPSSKDNISTVSNPLPAAPSLRALSDTVFCDGGNVSILVTPNDATRKYSWERNSKLSGESADRIAVSGTELIKAYVTDVKNCNSKPSNAIQVVKKDVPKNLIITPKSTYSLVARSDKKADEYTWKFEGKILPNKDSLIRITDKGGYSVIGKNIYTVKSSLIPLTCVSPETEKYVFNPYDDKGLSIFPNPSGGVFNLESRYDLDNATIYVYSTLGKLLYQGSVTVLNAQRTIDLSSLAEGSYILRVESVNFRIAKLIAIAR